MNRKVAVLLVIFLGVTLTASLSFFLRSSSALAQAPADRPEVIRSGIAYLKTQQQADGGILGFSGVSDPDTTARSVLAFITTGEDVSSIRSADGISMVDYLATQAISFTHDMTGTLFPGRAGELLSAAAVAGVDPAGFGQMDLAGELEATLQPDTGAYSTTAKQDFSSGQASDLNQAWAILGLSLAGHELPQDASQYLIQSQGEDGSWGFGDPDTTALAVTALIASRQVNSQDQVLQNALQYFHTNQLDNGGWRPSWDTDPLNADSTGWILQALISAGEDPTSESWKSSEGNPVDALMSLQKSDGSIGGTYANTYSTAEAIIGLSGVPLIKPGESLPENRAGLAIFFGDGSVYTTCVSFSGDSISGFGLLDDSGLDIESATNPTQGTAVCRIREVGSRSNEDCFSQMPNYWSYWQQGETGWEYSPLGAAQAVVVDGAVNAWSWGIGDPPPAITFENICEGIPFVMPEATQTASPSTDTPEPTAVPTSTAAAATQPSVKTVTSQPTAGTYVVYGAIVLVFGALFVYIITSRKKQG